MFLKIRFWPRISVKYVPIFTEADDLKSSRRAEDESNGHLWWTMRPKKPRIASAYGSIQSEVDALESDRRGEGGSIEN
jgi:hypothetical protein